MTAFHIFMIMILAGTVCSFYLHLSFCDMNYVIFILMDSIGVQAKCLSYRLVDLMAFPNYVFIVFLSQQAFERHMQYHAGHKRHQCPHCEYRYIKEEFRSLSGSF